VPRPLDPAAAHGAHLLALPDGIAPEEVEVLAVSRFPHARWERGPQADPQHPQRDVPGVLRLSRVSTLEGPFHVEPESRGALGLPVAAALAYGLPAPRERAAAPFRGAGDRDGMARAFAAGMPVRDELRVTTWLVAAARRLGGAVRCAGAPGDPTGGAILVPDPAAAVDLTLWSDIWLEPMAALVVTRRAVPRAHLEVGRAWQGPPEGTGTIPVIGAEDLDPRERAALHAHAEARDVEVLSAPPVRTAFGLLAELGLDGKLSVRVGGEEDLPVVLADLPWAHDGAIAYRVAWEPDDLRDRESERPPMEHRIARRRVASLVDAVARELHAAVGGEITDEMGFLVDPADLAGR
jgi:hypothetical protein